MGKMPSRVGYQPTLASEGLYPAIDPLNSSSKLLNKDIIGAKHYNIAREIKKTLSIYEDLKDIIAMLGIEELSEDNRLIVYRARRLERFLTQPFFTTEEITGMEGKLVNLNDALTGCEKILNDEYKDYDENDLYLIGNIEEADEKKKSRGK